MKINFQLEIPSSILNPNPAGILLSLLGTIEDILKQDKKATAISFFWRERLNKKEKKLLLNILNQFIVQLSINLENSKIPLSEETKEPGTSLEGFWKSYIRDFPDVGVSEQVTIPHQSPQTGETPKKTIIL